jgi:hypothetical protein
LAFAGWTAYQGKLARDDLTAARAGVERLTDAVATGNSGLAREALFDIQDASQKADSHTNGPGWLVGGYLPIVGDDIAGVRTVAVVTNDVATEVLPGLVDASAALSPAQLQPSGGRIDIAGLVEAQDPLTTANTALQGQVARIDALRPDDMIGPIAAPVRDLQSAIGGAASVTERATMAVDLLPGMLGQDGKRTYLVLFQTNAEIRATGGMPGALVLMTVDNGAIKLVEQGTAKSMGSPRENSVLPLNKAERSIFGDQIGTYPADVTFTPDFPRVAKFAQAMWEDATGQRVDGVLSADPVALSYLLEGTGPIPIAGDDTGELSADNAVQVLLNQAYFDIDDPEAQNEYFADAGRSVFDAVAAGQGDPRTTLDAMVRGTNEHRLLVWSDNGEEQADLSTTLLSGALPTEATDSPDVGIYLNDATGTKLDYYLDYDVTLKPLSCSENGAQEQRVTVTMTSNAPADAATSLPPSILGFSRSGRLFTNLYIYAPVDGDIGGATLDGEKLAFAPYQHGTRPVAGATIELKPQGTRTMTYVVTSGPDQPGEPDVRVTPGVPGSGTVQTAGSAC